jgi:hypothetical protein
MCAVPQYGCFLLFLIIIIIIIIINLASGWQQHKIQLQASTGRAQCKAAQMTTGTASNRQYMQEQILSHVQEIFYVEQYIY